MKHNKIFRGWVIAIVLSLVAVVMPATPALAQLPITLSTISGPIGTTVTITSTGFISHHDTTVYIFWGDDYSSRTSALVNTLGYFAASFSVPTYAILGATYVTVQTAPIRGGSTLAIASFTVTRAIAGKITLKLKEGTVGTEVEISGEDYGDREDISVEYDGDEVDIKSGDDKTDTDGEFQNTKIIIPPSTAGDHTITAIGEDSATEAEATFTVEPEITINPESGAAGSTITVNGTGFGDRIDFIVFFDNIEVVTNETTDRYGSFAADFNMPVLGPGIYDVEVVDEDDNSGTATFTIAAAAISLSKTEGYVGDEVTVSGTGFIANHNITITFGGSNINTSPASITTDSQGSFSARFTVPALTASTYRVKASDGTNTLEDNYFKIGTSASISPVTSAALSGHVGTQLTISGIGFIAGITVTITYDGTQVATATVNTDETFSATFNAPASIAGDHSIIATDATNTKQFTFVMESTPPSTVYPQLPLMNSKLKDWRFDWCGDATDLTKEVTDDSLPITYTLQIATDEDFSEGSTVLEKTGLTQSEYTITKEEKLESVSKDTPYYWRVRAIDGASNEGQWSGTGSFYVGFSGLPQPVIYTLFGVGALLLGILGFWLGRKTAYY